MQNTRLKTNKLYFPFLLVSLIVLSSACTQRYRTEAVPPEDLISKDTMVGIFVDLRLLDAVINLEQKKRNRKTNELNYYLHNSIMEKYDITREQFESSYQYYQHDLEILDDIYMEAITRLSKMKSTVDQE